VAVRNGSICYHVRLSIPRCGGWRAWLPVCARFEEDLARQESPPVISARIESEARRGKDFVRVTILVAVSAPDVAEALGVAWRVFRQAAAGDLAGWDMAGATAEVRPGEPCPARATGRDHA
jgi:hypothetical protein